MELNVETNRKRVCGAHEPLSHSLASARVTVVKSKWLCNVAGEHLLPFCQLSLSDLSRASGEGLTV